MNSAPIISEGLIDTEPRRISRIKLKNRRMTRIEKIRIFRLLISISDSTASGISDLNNPSFIQFCGNRRVLHPEIVKDAGLRQYP